MTDTIVFKKPDELKKYERNSRLHSQKQIEQIAASITEFGFTVPILIDDKNMVLAGHARLEAARLLDMKHVPTITAIGWSDAQKMAYVIADNKLAENSDWDMELLKQELDDLKNFELDLDLTGFTHEEIKKLIPPEVENFLNDQEKNKIDFSDVFSLLIYFDTEKQLMDCEKEYSGRGFLCKIIQ